MRRNNHTYAEAFCLMTYRCDKCKREEELWNSRDGVTPFMIGCTKCDGAMTHINFTADKYLPNYTVFNGQRIFIDMTEEKQNSIIEKAFEQYKKQVNHVVDEEEKKEFFTVMKSDFREGTPEVITWGEIYG